MITVTALLCVVGATNELTEAEKAEGWKLLFDGQSLAGWGTTGKPEGWAVEDGAIACTVQGGKYLYSKEQFEDFTLSAEFKFEPKTNSGIFFRWSDLSDPVDSGIEMQVLDT